MSHPRTTAAVLLLGLSLVACADPEPTPLPPAAPPAAAPAESVPATQSPLPSTPPGPALLRFTLLVSGADSLEDLERVQEELGERTSGYDVALSGTNGTYSIELVPHPQDAAAVRAGQSELEAHLRTLGELESAPYRATVFLVRADPDSILERDFLGVSDRLRETSGLSGWEVSGTDDSYEMVLDQELTPAQVQSARAAVAAEAGVEASAVEVRSI